MTILPVFSQFLWNSKCISSGSRKKLSLLYLIPLIIVAILNVWIVKSLRKTNPAIQKNSHISITRNKRNHRVMKMLILIIVFFFLSYTPRVTFAVAWNFHIKNVHVQMFAVEVAYIITAFILPVLSTFLNPVIIFSFSTNYQGHPMDLFLKISVLQANFCWLGDVEEIIVPGRKVLLGKI